MKAIRISGREVLAFFRACTRSVTDPPAQSCVRDQEDGHYKVTYKRKEKEKCKTCLSQQQEWTTVRKEDETGITCQMECMKFFL